MTGNRHLVVVGCGRWGRLIVRDLRSLGMTSTSVVDPAVPADRGATLGIHEWVATLDEVSAEQWTNVDAIFIATPASTHAAVITECAARFAGSIFVEKPFTTSARDAERLDQSIGERLSVLHTWRHHPAVQALGDVAASGRLGTITGLVTERSNWTSPRRDVDALWTLLPHDLSIALHLLGEVPHPTGVQLEQLDGRVVSGHVLATTSHGATLSTRISTRSTVKRRAITLHGTDAVASFAGDDSDHIEVAGGRGLEPTIELVRLHEETAMQRQLRCCLDHLNGGPAPGSTSSEATRIVKTVEHVRRMGRQ